MGFRFLGFVFVPDWYRRTLNLLGLLFNYYTMVEEKTVCFTPFVR